MVPGPSSGARKYSARQRKLAPLLAASRIPPRPESVACAKPSPAVPVDSLRSASLSDLDVLPSRSSSAAPFAVATEAASFLDTPKDDDEAEEDEELLAFEPPWVQKSFAISGNPECANLDVLREELLLRGFRELHADTSFRVGVLWGPRQKVNYKSLAPWQRVNHFEYDAELTTKSGLSQNLQSPHCLVNSKTFYPASFCLSSDDNLDAFSQEFKFSQAMCVLKAWLKQQSNAHHATEGTFEEGVVQVALRVVSQRVNDLDSRLISEDNEAEQTDFSVAPGDWDVLKEMDFANPTRKNQALHEQAERFSGRGGIGTLGRSTSASNLRSQSSNVSDKQLRWAASTSLEDGDLFGAALLVAVRKVIAVLEREPQFNLHHRNIWIMKPSNSLRGQGIIVDDDLDSIMKLARAKQATCPYVCQKYIENPLLIGGIRKHDIRQWVLVTCANPLTIWFFSECYVRVAANDYSLDSLKDRFKHLTHTIIMRQHPNFDPDDEYWRCQWDQDSYRRLLLESAGTDVWTTQVLPAMKRIVLDSLLTVQEALFSPEGSESCFQLFGYDFLVDTDYSVWLLEVNDIPMMQASGPVTERLCDWGLRDVLALTLDGPKRTSQAPVQFELLYAGAPVPRCQPSSLLGLSVEGRAVARPKNVELAEETKALQQKLVGKRMQELQDLASKRRLKEEQKKQLRERRLRARQALASKILGRSSIV